jgi:hypothetical protein
MTEIPSLKDEEELDVIGELISICMAQLKSIKW